MINSVFHGECRQMSGTDLLESLGGLTVNDEIAAHIVIKGASTLADAEPNDISFLDNPRYLKELQTTEAGIVFVAEQHLEYVPNNTYGVVVKEVYSTFAQAVGRLYPRNFNRSFQTDSNDSLISNGAFAHSTAIIENGVEIAHGAYIGPNAKIGTETFIGQNTTIGQHCTIGRNCYIMPGVTIECAHVGDNVVIHSGARIGQDGFGFAMSQSGHSRVLQLGSVIIQDDVDIGANSTVDRGTLRDTIIGQGSKIDNQVQIAHNVQMGAHCVLAGQVGIAGSTTLGDFVVLGGKVGVAGHIELGSGTQAAAGSLISKGTEPGSIIGGAPAKDVRTWRREIAAIALLGKKSTRK